MNFRNGLLSFLQALLHPVRSARNLFALANQLRRYALIHAYYVWSQRGILATRGIMVKRSGSAVNHALTKGIIIIVQIIMLVIAGYFAALLVPGLLTAFATTALTSVSSAVITLFQTILPFTFVTVVILLFLAVLIETFKEI